METVEYTSVYKSMWDDFVDTSKNGTFLFYRDFMEYHADRFDDRSLIFFSKNKPKAILPGNISGNVFYSHGGLTYGGLILSRNTGTADVLKIFSELINYLKKLNVDKIIYKTVPSIYHKFSSEEDLYALFRHNAVFASRAVSSVIDLEQTPVYTTLRKRQIKKAVNIGLNVNETIDFSDFWEILSRNLTEKFRVLPVHSLEEINYLKSKFPENIRLFTVSDNGETVAGCVIFETDRVAHVQYISANEKGKRTGALDILFDRLITNIYREKKYFDFGISTENNGRFLNEGLISQKEGFGGRGIVYDTYMIDI